MKGGGIGIDVLESRPETKNSAAPSRWQPCEIVRILDFAGMGRPFIRMESRYRHRNYKFVFVKKYLKRLQIAWAPSVWG